MPDYFVFIFEYIQNEIARTNYYKFQKNENVYIKKNLFLHFVM